MEGVPGVDEDVAAVYSPCRPVPTTSGEVYRLNRSGTTFRKLPDADKQDLDAAKAVKLMLANPSAIKRPVVEHSGGLLVGFNEAEWSAALR